MKILLTGASGFLGNIIYQQLSVAHEIICLGRNDDATIKADLRHDIPRLPKVDMVVHAAGKAHMVPKNKEQEQQFYDVNVTGTSNLLTALESNLPDSFILISTVAVYGLEIGENIDETTPVKATEAYGKSKSEAEKLVRAWSLKNNVKVIILRLPLIYGPNPVGNLKAMTHAIRAGYYFRIGKGEARRSMVSAVDVAAQIPSLINFQGTFHLTDGQVHTVSTIDTAIGKMLNRKIKVMPHFMAKMLAYAGDFLHFIPFNTRRLGKLSHSLTFSDQLARKELKWNPPLRNGYFE